MKNYRIIFLFHDKNVILPFIFFSAGILMMIYLPVMLVIGGVAINAQPHDFRTPLTIDSHGVFRANIVSSSNDNVTMPAELCVHPRSSLYSPHILHGPARVAFGMIDNGSHVYSIEITDPVLSPLSDNILGIGLTSDIVLQSGAVALIRKNDITAEFIIGSTREYFRENCQPDTFITLNASSTGLVDVEIISRIANTSITFGSRRAQFLAREPYSADCVPPGLYDHIVSVLIAAGSFYSDENRFYQCRESVVDSLPNIEFRFASGSILHYPEDYIRFDSEESACFLRLGRGREEGRSVIIDPLMLVGQNVRVTSSNIWEICESLE
jgi:hypothetical protein